MQGVEPVALILISKAALAGLRAGQGKATLAESDSAVHQRLDTQ